MGIWTGEAEIGEGCTRGGGGDMFNEKTRSVSSEPELKNVLKR